jgi:hypothetical protein
VAVQATDSARRRLMRDPPASCSFDLGHYEELLDAAESGGYRFAFFDGRPEPATILLRHDVDLSLGSALTMAELEAERGVTATYFLMTRSEFYNLDSASGEAALDRLRGLGHQIGLHAVWPHADFDERFDPVFVWHNPDPQYMHVPVDGLVNVFDPPWGDVYRSDSNQRWRHGCPHEELRAGAFERLQLLIHPEIWVHSGETMRATMIAWLDAERERLLEQMADDRIDLS